MKGNYFQILFVGHNGSDNYLLQRLSSDRASSSSCSSLRMGAEALAYVQQERQDAANPAFDLVVLDLSLLKIEGLRSLAR